MSYDKHLYNSIEKFSVNKNVFEKYKTNDTTTLYQHSISVYQLFELVSFSNRLRDYIESNLINSWVFILPPSLSLEDHIDGAYDSYKRLLFIIEGNEKCENRFYLDDDNIITKVFEDERIYWFESTKIKHNIFNNGNTIRYSLIIDVKKTEEFENLLVTEFEKHEL
jgi:hypothetical protein